MNALETDFEDQSFHYIIDKCLYDCILSGYDHKRQSHKYLSEIDRILKPKGKFILISHSPYSQRESLFKSFNWNIDCHKIYRTV